MVSIIRNNFSLWVNILFFLVTLIADGPYPEKTSWFWKPNWHLDLCQGKSHTQLHLYFEEKKNLAAKMSDSFFGVFEIFTNFYLENIP